MTEYFMPNADDFAVALIGARADGVGLARVAAVIADTACRESKPGELWRVLAGVALVARGFEDRAVRAGLGLLDKVLPKPGQISDDSRYLRVCAAFHDLEKFQCGDGRMAHVIEGVAG